MLKSKKPGATKTSDIGDLSDDDGVQVQSTLRAANVFGKVKLTKPNTQVNRTGAVQGATNQPNCLDKPKEYSLLSSDPRATDKREGSSLKKRGRVIDDDEDDEEPASSDRLLEDQPPASWRSSPSCGSHDRGLLPSISDKEVVPESSDDVALKQQTKTPIRDGVSSKRTNKRLKKLAQLKTEGSEIQPSSFYPSHMSRTVDDREVIDLDPILDSKAIACKDAVDTDLEERRPVDKGRESLEDPVNHALRECEKIASRLRHQLHIAEGATEGYKEVNAAAAALVSQAEITAACASDSTSSDTSPTLKAYQLIGVNFLLLLRRQNIGGAICADEMGLGKTVQAITYLGLLSQETGQGPHLVVCPASLLENWSREFRIWCPALTLVVYHGPERAHVRHSIEMGGRKKGGPVPFDVLLTTYSLFERSSVMAAEDRSFLRRFDWNCVVMDEAHLLKDQTSTRTRKLRNIASAAKCRLMLTGTPLQNDLQELWTLLNFLLPDIFQLKDLEAAGGRSDDPDTQASLIGRLKTILAPFVLRRVKADVMQQLVAKEQKVETVAMHPGQAELYRSALEAYKEQVGATGRVDKLPKRQVANIFTHLRKIANHPLLIRSKFSDEDVRAIATKLHSWGVYNVEASVDRIFDELVGNSDYELHRICGQYPRLAERSLTRDEALASGKCEVLSRLLPELRAKGSRPLIFSQWTAMLDVLEWVMELLGLSYVRLDGSTQVSDRQELVDTFNGDESVFAFLLSTRAGGQGLNLTGADTVILHDVDFNPQVDRQAEDRCHRIGQTRPVTVYRLVSAGTVDESILKIANRKLSLDAAVLTDTGKTSGDPDSKTMGEILASLLVEA